MIEELSNRIRCRTPPVPGTLLVQPRLGPNGEIVIYPTWHVLRTYLDENTIIRRVTGV